MEQVPMIALEAWVAPTASASPAALRGGVSSGSIGAMNWAAWEYRIGVARRTDLWRMEFRVHPDSARRRPLWSSRDCLPVETVEQRHKFKHSYGGPVSYRYGKPMASILAAQQRLQHEFLNPLLDCVAKLANPPMIVDFESHTVDAMAYGCMMHQSIEWKVRSDPILMSWGPTVKHEYHERAGDFKWRHKPVLALPSTGLGRSQNAMLLRERGQTVTCKPVGRPSRMPRRSMR